MREIKFNPQYLVIYQDILNKNVDIFKNTLLSCRFFSITLII